MKSKSIFRVLALCLISLTLIAGCDKNNDDDNNNNNNGCQMTAKVDNADFCGSGYYAHDAGTGVMTIQATNATTMETIQVTINNAAVGSFQFGLGTDGAGYTSYQDTYLAINGTMTITKFENNTVEGTLTFTGQLIGGSATKTITDGSFSIPKL
jgi:hypothetical protein